MEVIRSVVAIILVLFAVSALSKYDEQFVVLAVGNVMDGEGDGVGAGAGIIVELDWFVPVLEFVEGEDDELFVVF